MAWKEWKWKTKAYSLNKYKFLSYSLNIIFFLLFLYFSFWFFRRKILLEGTIGLYLDDILYFEVCLTHKTVYGGGCKLEIKRAYSYYIYDYFILIFIMWWMRICGLNWLVNVCDYGVMVNCWNLLGLSF